MTGPYNPPPFPSPTHSQGNWDPISLDPPPIIMWFKIYMVVQILMNLLIVGAGFFMGIMADEIASDPSEGMGLRLAGFLYVLWGFVMSVFFGATLFIPTRPWAWIFNIIAICVTMLTVCCIPFSVVIIIFWAREDVRRWYGMQ